MNTPNHASRLLALCINLPRRKDRAFVIRQLLPEVAGAPVHFHAAIDGQEVPTGKMSRYPKGTTPSGYAVRLTKCLALRRFLRSSHEYLLLLEDDVVVTDTFDEKLTEAMRLNRDVVFLGGKHHVESEGDGDWRRCRSTSNHHALLFSREGATKSLKRLRKWQEPCSNQELRLAIEEEKIDAWCPADWVAYPRKSQSDHSGSTGEIDLADLGKPMMAPDDLAVLDAALIFSNVVVEYGSGESTLHLATRLQDSGRLISIEHQRTWHEKVSSTLSKNGLKIDYLLAEPNPLRNFDGPWRYLRSQMSEYVEAPHQLLADGEADLVFVDGRHRIDCALTCAPLLREGGLLMIHDFWPRHRYRVRMAELLKDYDYLWDTPGKGGSDPQGMAVFQKKS